MSNRLAHATVFRALLTRPGPAFSQALARAMEDGVLPLAVAKRIAPFHERVADLSADELQELYDETFGQVNVSATPLRGAGTRVAELLSASASAPAGRGEATAELCDLVERVEAALTAARNPYSHVFSGLAVLLRDTLG